MTKARIIRSDKRLFECRLLGAQQVVTATALGNLLKNDSSLVVGDFVDLAFDQKMNEYTITQCDPRKNEIFRLQVREQRKRVTAANCDLLVAVTSASKPAFKHGVLDRFLIRAAQWNMESIVIFNKMDEYNPANFKGSLGANSDPLQNEAEDFDINYQAQRLKGIDAKIFEISSTELSYRPRFLKNGYPELKEELKNKTAIFLGQSGVGKSRLISCLSEGKVSLQSNQISKVGKGSHTTTWSEIINVGDFELIDSPGIRSISLEDIDPDELMQFFPDLFRYASHCKFSNCAHDGKTPGCTFKKFLEGTDTESEMVRSRLDSYKKIHEEVSQTPEWQKRW